MIQSPSTGPTLVIRADPTRNVTRLFIPGREEVGPGNSRAGVVIDRVMQMSEADVAETMDEINRRFAHRHRDFDSTLLQNEAAVDSRIDSGVVLSPERRRLIGACFTHEYSTESAALCNPSVVLAPITPVTSGDDEDGDDGGEGDVAFVMSVRGIGEGHRSSIGFRTGILDRFGKLTVNEPGPYPVIATTSPSRHRRRVFESMLSDSHEDAENSAFVLSSLPDEFDDAELEERIALLAADQTTRRGTEATIASIRFVASSSYAKCFEPETDLSERVLWPHSPAESHGMEDARFVRFTDDDGSVSYLATYTAFDGILVAQHLLETKDFRLFDMSPLSGDAAVGKGLAIFPRKIQGRYAALSRSDRETNTITFAEHVNHWADTAILQVPEEPWEIIQLGNCGSPIETDRGWLVLTHGVGPMRTYSLGVLLLDLENPEKVLARSTKPILSPSEEHREGYVPNVVYSCGGFAVGDTLVLPYGMADQAIGVTTFSINEILASLTAV